jgi:hypothetical protein
MNETRRRALGRLSIEYPDDFRALMQFGPKAAFEEERELYENSFRAFVLRAWQEVDPTPIKLSPFHEVVIEHLEMVARGEIRSLIINAPPRTCGKIVNCISALSRVGLVPF